MKPLTFCVCGLVLTGCAYKGDAVKKAEEMEYIGKLRQTQAAHAAEQSDLARKAKLELERQGYREAEFRENAKKLTPSMTMAEVRALLGDPRATESKTFGSATPDPWNGIVWWYGRLMVVFSPGVGGYSVNGWNWMAFDGPSGS